MCVRACVGYGTASHTDNWLTQVDVCIRSSHFLLNKSVDRPTFLTSSRGSVVGMQTGLWAGGPGRATDFSLL